MIVTHGFYLLSNGLPLGHLLDDIHGANFLTTSKPSSEERVTALRNAPCATDGLQQLHATGLLLDEGLAASCHCLSQ
jgi:hypothetical protein